MPLRVACQMDPIERIDIRGDSTFAILLEAQRRGHEIFYYTPHNLALDSDVLIAAGHALSVADTAGAHYRLGRHSRENLAHWDVVLLRQDPPFDMSYITTTHLLERIHPKTLVVNDPKEVRNAPEKLFVTEFSEFIPPTLITSDLREIRAFRDERARQTAGARTDFVHRRARDARLARDPARQIEIEDEVLPKRLLRTQPVCGNHLTERWQRV